MRPWLYRIVRNTALNDLRDRPPAAAELAEDLVAGTRSAAAEAEAREEVAELVEHLRALPENQRAALLMRELDGMGHDEIAAALGISKGAARQAIARGRAAVRSGFGALLPLPLVAFFAGRRRPDRSGRRHGRHGRRRRDGDRGGRRRGAEARPGDGGRRRLARRRRGDRPRRRRPSRFAATRPRRRRPEPAPHAPPSERSQLAVTTTENCERTAVRRLETWPTTPAAAIGPTAEGGEDGDDRRGGEDRAARPWRRRGRSTGVDRRQRRVALGRAPRA